MKWFLYSQQKLSGNTHTVLLVSIRFHGMYVFEEYHFIFRYSFYYFVTSQISNKELNEKTNTYGSPFTPY